MNENDSNEKKLPASPPFSISSLFDKDFIKQKALEATEAVTGLASMGKKELFRQAGRLAQDAIKGRFWQSFGQKWNEFKKKGRIAPDFETSQQGRSLFLELLECLDEDWTDEERLEILKKIFFVAATLKESDENNLLPLEYMKICRTLSSGDILVLNATYSIVTEGGWNPKLKIADSWLSDIAKDSGLNYSELVESHEQKLIEKNLITPRTRSDKSGVNPGKYYRLSGLGYALCDFIQNYEKIEPDLNQESTRVDKKPKK